VPVERGEVTRLLRAWRAGDAEALNQLLPLVIGELKRVARAYLARERHAESWQPTMLVNEAYLRLVDCQQVTLQDQAHFYRLAAKKMREILVDYARKKRLQKMGGSLQKVELPPDVPDRKSVKDRVDLIAVHTALEELHAQDPRKAEIVEMRFFGGLSIEEIAEVLGLGVSTVHRELQFAKVWLFHAIYEGTLHES